MLGLPPSQLLLNHLAQLLRRCAPKVYISNGGTQPRNFGPVETSGKDVLAVLTNGASLSRC